MKATSITGDLNDIPNCDIQIPWGERAAGAGLAGTSGWHQVKMRILPEISDTKSAQYQDEAVIGRSFPVKTYSHSENRTITMKIHFIITKSSDAIRNLKDLRALQSATYPRESERNPYLPPPICKIRCGHLLSGPTSGGYLCAILRQYAVDFPTDVAWFQDASNRALYVPYKFDMSLTWDIVYPNENLPGQTMILSDL